MPCSRNPRQEVKVYLDEIHINGKQRSFMILEELNLSFEREQHSFQVCGR
jgi:hypothetical protein